MTDWKKIADEAEGRLSNEKQRALDHEQRKALLDTRVEMALNAIWLAVSKIVEEYNSYVKTTQLKLSLSELPASFIVLSKKQPSYGLYCRSEDGGRISVVLTAEYDFSHSYKNVFTVSEDGPITLSQQTSQETPEVFASTQCQRLIKVGAI